MAYVKDVDDLIDCLQDFKKVWDALWLVQSPLLSSSACWRFHGPDGLGAALRDDIAHSRTEMHGGRRRNPQKIQVRVLLLVRNSILHLVDRGPDRIVTVSNSRIPPLAHFI